ncbi:MAG TPA: peptidoglycan DD-metalloendopeptidase family protein [Xanthobacteraceae bacterium]|jgi:septal ring factor EnvC (AmiA/AmiB activator)|nr:peptidoglycan DD-metalloendopeptidase family protein [Xanthobacteraceae bacterium]
MTTAVCHSAGPRTLLAMVAACALALPFGPASAQKLTLDSAQKPTLDDVKQRDQELDAVRAEQKKALESQKALRDEINAIGEDRRKLNQALIDTAGGIRSVEGRVAAAEARLQQLLDSEGAIRKSLDGRRAVIVEVLAAIQRIGRRPPPALMVKPEDALESVRTAMLLGAVVPEMRAEAEALAGELGDLVRVRAEAAAERDGLARDLMALSFEKNRMTLLVDERQKRQTETEKKLEAERQRAAELSRQADNLKDLITRLERGLDNASRAARSAEESRALGDTRADLPALKDPGRLGPAIAFASAKGVLPIPVNGVKSRDFGAPDGNGGTERGISIATRPGAQVTAPCDGWVVYAAPYRSYGRLLILNAGGGYHVVLAGMERISVDIGQFVLTGEPVAVMGSGPQIASAMVTGAAGSSQPMLYIEFRKDGSPVDPNPWWATPDSEKVRG